MNKSKTGKKLLSLLLSVLMCLSFVPTVAFATEENFFRDEFGVWHIANAAGLVEFSKSVSDNNNYKGETVVIDSDIDMNGVEYNSAGINSKVGFQGTLDGNNKSVTNLKISGESCNYTGLFYILTGTVKDLTFVNADMSGVRVGILAGAAYSCTVDNVDVVDSSVIGEQKCGGLIGFAMENSTITVSNCEIKNVSLKAATTKYSDVQGATFGGLIGFVHRDVNATITGNKVSGIKFEGLLGEDFYKTNGIIYYQYLSHPFIGAIMGTTSATNGNYNTTKTVLNNNTVEKVEELLTGPTTNAYMGFYYRSDFSSRPVTEIIIDGVHVNNREVAEIGDTKYFTLEDAFAAVKDSTPTEIRLLADCSGNGIKVEGGKNITVDFNGYTYTVDGETVGSASTPTNAFQLLKISDITFKNGSIVSSKARILIQNYSNLTVENMTLDLSQQTLYGYTLSNNNGNTVINNSIIKAPPANGSLAFDVCGFGNYDGATVTLKGNSLIEGNVNFSYETDKTVDVVLNIEGGTIKGNLTPGNGAEKVTVNKAETVALDAPSGYKWATEGNEQKLVKVNYVAEAGGTKFETLQAAVAAAENDDTVKLLSDVTEDIAITKNITLDLGGKTLTGTGAASTATLTVAKGAVVTVKNGSIIGTANSYYNIQNNGTAIFEDITATAGNTGSSMIDNWGTLTINSGDYSGGLNVVKSEEDSTLTINDGKFVSDYAPKSGITGTVLVYGDTTINGGVFIQNSTSTNARVIVTGIVPGYAVKTVITGGTFSTKSVGNILHRLTTVSYKEFVVSGGTFNKKIPDGHCADGFIQVKNSDGTYGVKEGKYVAKIGSTGYETLESAIKDAKSNNTVKLLEDITLTEQLTVSKKITLDLNGKTLTSTFAMADGAAGEARYALLLKNAVTVKNGTFAAGKARAIGAYGALTLDGVTVSTELTNGNACVALCANDATYTVKNSTVSGAYALSIFANNATVNVTDSVLTGNGNVLYHNGLNYGLKLTVSNTEITSTGSCGVYISGSTVTYGAAGYQNATFTNCTVTGATNGVEVKYTDLTLDGCTVKTTATSASYVQDNNGPAANGFAVVSTDNAVKGATPKPEGTVIITGDGKYTGLVGLASLESVKTDYPDFTDNTVKISGGTFSNEVLAEYCADGYVPTKNADGTYGVVEMVVTVDKQLTLGNDLTLSYIVKADGFNVSYVTFSIYDATLNGGKGGYTDPIKVLANAKGAFAFTGINPQRMVDTIKAVVYLEKDGVIYEYVVEDYSVKDYCLSVLSNSEYSEKWSEIISNLLVYGAEAQKYMNYRTDNLVTDYFKDCAGFKPVSHADQIDSVVKYDSVTNNDGKIEITAKQVILNNAVKVRVYFKVGDGVSIDDVKFNVAVMQNGSKLRPEDITEFGYNETYGYYFDYTGVMATELDNEIVFTATVNNDENLTLHYNVNQYIMAAKNAGSFGELAKALFSYGYTCDRF